MKFQNLLFYTVFIFLFTLTPPASSYAMPKLISSALPDKPDYSSPKAWLVRPTTPTEAVDVFFVYPTVLFNDHDWAMDPSNLEMRTAAQSTLNTQASVFRGQANIYAPLYRQMNLAGLKLSETESAPLQQMVHEDIWQAFNHYLKHDNNGRPFFLAGHSQGSMILTDLMLEHWGSTGVENQLIAAFLLGWSLTPEDLASHPAIQMCEGHKQTGCIISYNTIAQGRQSVAPTLKTNALAVNPLSWNMVGDFVPASENLGSVFFDSKDQPTTYHNFTSAQIVAGGLVVQPQNIDLVTIKGGHFPQGVYHAFDYSLFYMNIKSNIAERIKAFTYK